MNRPSLSDLYRRLPAAEAGAQALDLEALAAVAEGTLAAERRDDVARALASSPAHAAVARMLRELTPESEALAADVASVRRSAGHRRGSREERRIAAGRRFGRVARWSTALAACLVAVIGVWTQRQLQTTQRAAATHAVARADEIFNSKDTIFAVGMDGMRLARKATRTGDRLFRADFSGGG